jgi:hypothetical protein
MAQPFDPNHILKLEFIPVNIDYEYAVQIEQLRSRFESRNLEDDQVYRKFSLSLSGDDPANHAEYKRLKSSYERARGPFEGFYLRLPKIIEKELIPVRFDSPFRFRFVAASDTEIIWDIADLRLIEIRVP